MVGRHAKACEEGKWLTALEGSGTGAERASASLESQASQEVKDVLALHDQMEDSLADLEAKMVLLEGLGCTWPAPGDAVGLLVVPVLGAICSPKYK